MLSLETLIKLLPIELQWHIGQYCSIYFPFDVTSAQYMINDSNFKKYLAHALKVDNIEQLRLVIAVMDPQPCDYWHRNKQWLTSKAIKVGAIDCFTFLIKNKYQYCINGTVVAAQYNQVAMLNYLIRCKAHKHPDTAAEAARAGNLQCLKIATEHNFPKKYDATFVAVLEGHFECLQYLTHHHYPKNPYVINLAVRRGDLPMVKYLVENNYPTSTDAREIVTAIKNDDFKTVKYLTDAGCRKDSSAIKNAIRYDNLEILEYLLANKFPVSLSATKLAAYKGHLQCLILLTESGYEKHPGAIFYAAYAGHYDCVVYLHENGYEKHPYAICGAKDLRIIKFLIENGYEKHKDATYLCRDNKELLKFLLDQGFEDMSSCGNYQLDGHYSDLLGHAILN